MAHDWNGSQFPSCWVPKQLLSFNYRLQHHIHSEKGDNIINLILKSIMESSTHYLRHTTSNMAHDSSTTIMATSDSVQRQMFGNNASMEDTSDTNTRWDRNGDASFLLFLLFIIFGLVFLSARLSCYFNRNSGSGSNSPPEQEGSPNRSQEFIEKLLVLKNVLWVTSDDSEQYWKQQAKYHVDRDLDSSTTKRNKRAAAKSNLVLQEGKEDEDSGFELCAICLCPYEDGDQICWSNNKQCLHHFHAACGIAWLAKHEDCPICRAAYLVEPEEKNLGEGNNNVAAVTESSNETATSGPTNIEEVADDHDGGRQDDETVTDECQEEEQVVVETPPPQQHDVESGGEQQHQHVEGHPIDGENVLEEVQSQASQ